MSKYLAVALLAAAAAPAAAVPDLTKVAAETFATFSQPVPAHGVAPKLAYYKNEDVTHTTVVVTRVPHTTTTTVIVQVPTQVVTKVTLLNSHGQPVVVNGKVQTKNVYSTVMVPTPKQVTTTTYTNVATYSTHTTPRAEIMSTPGNGGVIGSPVMKFNYKVPVASWAQSQLVGTQSAYMTFDALSTSAAIVTGTSVSEMFDSGSISFIRTTPVIAHDYKGRQVGGPLTNLLTVNFTDAKLEGSLGSSTFTLDASTPGSTITYTSDFLSFTNTFTNNLSFLFNAAIPHLALATTTPTATNQTNVTGAHTLVSTRASIAGQFGASAVPEPAIWGMMLAGFGMIGLRRRRTTPVVTN